MNKNQTLGTGSVVLYNKFIKEDKKKQIYQVTLKKKKKNFHEQDWGDWVQLQHAHLSRVLTIFSVQNSQAFNRLLQPPTTPSPPPTFFF